MEVLLFDFVTHRKEAVRDTAGGDGEMQPPGKART